VPNDNRLRLLRYAVSGGASALTHVGVLFLGVEALGVAPVVASTVGFVASIAVSYLLQHAWVFRTDARHRTAGPRFLAVTAVAFGTNAAILMLGTEVASLPYPLVQAVALVAIPIVNYTLNARWTFAAGRPGPASGPARENEEIAL
jgi:putative flippase GtrA